MYDAVNGIKRVLWLYQESFPSRHMPNHKEFQRFHRKLYENGSYIVSTDERGRSRTVRKHIWKKSSWTMWRKQAVQEQGL
ncbi:hypothetical protein TNCT_637141 [Trichonephila clavata]|uniref:Uncharacterized protein n=1 Tax=Trichonephila clavata TaxID=2740835 RepID=A0A8X6K532_TRICU|nr:hypothetical protein TNCT_637141 [Trichonephila clavata]